MAISGFPFVSGVPSFRPRKSLGQNFLRDENIARKIVNAIDPHGPDPILEIGPGEGVLTKYLAAGRSPLILVELDRRIVDSLRARYTGHVSEILHADVLEVDLHALARQYGRLRIVGNIPYNITSPILFHILDNRAAVTDAVLLMQREVAHRLAAQPGCKEYGILSVFWQLWATVEVLFNVSPGVFFPQPSVQSSLVRLTMRKEALYPVADEMFFRQMVRSIFGKRRKTLRNSLRHFLGEEVVLPEGVNLQQRPEELPVGELVRLAALVRASANRSGKVGSGV